MLESEIKVLRGLKGGAGAILIFGCFASFAADNRSEDTVSLFSSTPLLVITLSYNSEHDRSTL